MDGWMDGRMDVVVLEYSLGERLVLYIPRGFHESRAKEYCTALCFCNEAMSFSQAPPFTPSSSLHILKQSIPQRTPHHPNPSPNRLPRPPRLQRGINLHQIHSHQLPRLSHTLGDIIRLPERKPAPNRGPRRRRPLRVQRVDVKGEMDGGVGADVEEGGS